MNNEQPEEIQIVLDTDGLTEEEILALILKNVEQAALQMMEAEGSA